VEPPEPPLEDPPEPPLLLSEAGVQAKQTASDSESKLMFFMSLSFVAR
jgi:hypothetical protein